MKLNFPHISRIFSAKTVSWVGNLCLWILLLALISLNVFLWLNKPLAYSDKIIDVFTHPFAWSAHVALADTFWQNGFHTQAMEEQQVAVDLSPKEEMLTNTQVLGAWQNEPNRQKQSEDYWQQVLTSHPDYRDAYIQLAALLYRKGNLTQAHAYLLKAQNLDPNNPTVNRLTAFTSKLLE
jgi:tetratricopeptide (TPR) repeat protein